MAPRFSFITANFVARQSNYDITDWGAADAATHAHFSPLATFKERFKEVLLEAKGLGFDQIDLWGAHLHWTWATLPHIDAAKDVLRELGITVRSYASWVTGGLNDLEGACRLCAALDISMIAGVIFSYESHRAETVAILRRHGVRYAHENHPEKSAEEILARIGESDTDIVGLAFDTGWCGTQSLDAPAAAKALRNRIFHVHLKDVLARRPGPIGRGMTDMGHETCALGRGIVNVQGVLRFLRETDYRGPIAIEHEPEDHKPHDDIRESVEIASRWWKEATPALSAPPLSVAIVGCGNIANAYGEAILGRQELRLTGAFDVDPARSKAFVEKFGGQAYASLDEVLADPAVECVVNLTIHSAHVEVVTRSLNAGKHVHSEKPLAPTHAECVSLIALAKQKGLRLSCAPVTWLGEGQQTAWKLIRDGRLGTPRAAYVAVDWARIEEWHPAPEAFYRVGPVMDVAVYPLTLLTAWFGPVKSILADGTIILPERRTKDGRPFTPGTEDFIVAMLTFANGLRLRLTANFYVGDPAENRAGYEIHGDDGSLAGNWFGAAAPLRIGAAGKQYEPVMPVRPSAGNDSWYCDWSAGLVELWRSLRASAPHPTNADHHAHVVEVMELIHKAARTGTRIEVTSTFPAPSPLPWAK
ncbi:MAG: Gfo/Idh/MocA family oxidoreductase [Opitutaceae bacterium]|nr:Gfo/Idh/MocA family oxidoreductase [Opitutaceae bacterium]